MATKFRSWDDYFTPGTTVLKNKFTETDPAKLSAKEEFAAAARLDQLANVQGFFKVGPDNSSAPVDSRTLVVSTTVFATKVRESTLVLRTLEKPCKQPDQLQGN